MYKNASLKSIIKVDNSEFADGGYLLKALSENNKVFYFKLIIR